MGYEVKDIEIGGTITLLCKSVDNSEISFLCTCIRAGDKEVRLLCSALINRTFDFNNSKNILIWHRKYTSPIVFRDIIVKRVDTIGEYEGSLKVSVLDEGSIYEERVSSRISINVEGSLSISGGVTHNCHINDISATGFAIICSDCVDIDNDCEFSISFDVDGKSFNLSGNPVWVKPKSATDYFYGCVMASISQEVADFVVEKTLS